MFTRVLTTTVLGAGVLLGAIAVVAAPATALGGAVCGAVVGVLGLVRVRDAAPGDAAAKARTGRRAGLIVGAGVTGGWLALTGLVLMLGPASGPALLLLLMITFSAWMWRRPEPGAALRAHPWRGAQDGLLRAAQRPGPQRRVGPLGRAKPRPSQAGPAAPSPSSVPDLGDLPTLRLCLAWQHSYFVLLDLPAGSPRAEVVLLRAELLDEFERRDPDGFTRWLDTGARAGSDPGRYLAGDR